jgi:hypothetical protein
MCALHNHLVTEVASRRETVLHDTLPFVHVMAWINSPWDVVSLGSD